MIFQIVTHFPSRYTSYLETGLPAKAYQKGLFQVEIARLRDFAGDEKDIKEDSNSNENKHVDSPPYGGGPGMVLQVGPVDRAIQSFPHSFPVILFTPRGKRLTQSYVRKFFSLSKGYTLVCGYFEGVDERIALYLTDYQVSLGDFVLGSGDLPALCFMESLTRLLPDYMGSKISLDSESMEEDGCIEHPHYTRPPMYRGWKVPEVLLSGNHQAIQEWRNLHKQKIASS